MIFKILTPKSIKKLIVFENIFEKIEKTVNMFKNDKKMLKFENFNSNLEFSVIFGPFNQLSKIF